MKEKNINVKVARQVFSRKNNSNLHISLVNEGKKPNDYESCNASFFQESNLKRHVHSGHEEMKPHECKSSNASFPRNKHINSIH